MGDLSPTLRPNATDRVAEGLQALTSCVDLVAPGVGSFFGMLIGHVLPNQRNERLAEFVTKLSRRLRVAEGGVEDLRQKYEQMAAQLGPQQRALFEDGAHAAVRATSGERLEEIARIVADGLNADEVKAEEQRRLLELLSDLSDEDVVVLLAYTHRYGRDPEWREKHRAALEPVSASIQSDQDNLDRATLRELRTDRLTRLGVLDEKLTANGKSSRRELSKRGRLVLRRLGLLGDREF